MFDVFLKIWYVVVILPIYFLMDLNEKFAEFLNRKKIYHVFTDQNVTKNHLQEIVDGITLEDGFVAADSVSYVTDDDKKQVGIEIHSGKNKIVRRIFEHLGYKVVKLDRVYFCGLTKKDLPRGRWRMLTPDEVNLLKMSSN